MRTPYKPTASGSISAPSAAESVAGSLMATLAGMRIISA
jgi:hypothetical protein